MSSNKTRRQGVIERRSGSWSYRFSHRVNGERRYERKSGFETKKEAERALFERLDQLDKGIVKDSKAKLAIYLSDWCKNYCESKSTKATTRDTTKIHVHSYLIPHLGGRSLGSIRPADLTEFYSTLLKAGRTGRGGSQGGLSPKTVRNIAGTLHKALRDAVSNGLLVSNPADKASLPRWERPELTVWDEVEVGRFLRYSQETDNEHFALWRLLLTTGLRRGELLGLRWSDVDLVGATIRVAQTRVVSNGRVIVSTPKTRAGARTIAIDAQTVTELARLKNRQDETFGTRLTDLVASRLDGRPIHPLTFTRTFQATAEKAGLPVMRLHDGRHTSATLALQHGVPVNVVSGRLGHSKTSTTLDVYSAWLPTADRLAADAIGRALAQLPSEAPLSEHAEKA